VPQSIVLFAHDLRPHGAAFYICSESAQRYFRTKVADALTHSHLSIFICSRDDPLWGEDASGREFFGGVGMPEPDKSELSCMAR